MSFGIIGGRNRGKPVRGGAAVKITADVSTQDDDGSQSLAIKGERGHAVAGNNCVYHDESTGELKQAVLLDDGSLVGVPVRALKQVKDR